VYNSVNGFVQLKTQPSQDAVVRVKGRGSPSYIIMGETLTVVDVCFPSDAKNILSLVSGVLGRSISDIKLVVITHCHFDHTNGIDYLVKETRALVAAHISAVKYLGGQATIPSPGLRKWLQYLWLLIKSGVPRPTLKDAFSMPWAGIPGSRRGIQSQVDICLKDGQLLPDNSDWLVLHTPGHTPDSICLYNISTKALIAGDTVMSIGGLPIFNRTMLLDRSRLIQSLDRIKNYQVDILYPGWGLPVYGNDLLENIVTKDY
jgi:hydroxyacylglutathione hydrolase